MRNNEVKSTAECNLLHDIINTPKSATNLNIRYSPILHVYMNTRKGRVKIKNFRILLNSGCNSTIVMERLVKIKPRRRFSNAVEHTSRKYHDQP